MVYPISDHKQSRDTLKSVKKSNRKRKRKSNSRKLKKDSIFKRKDIVSVSMSSWAEQFTAAATWQMKHQLAYWKAKAISLEYENKILHDIIRQNCSNAPAGPSSSKRNFRNVPDPKAYEKRSDNSDDSETDHDSMPDGGENWEVSEEFIDFLTKNAKFKEDARRERERLKAERAGKNDVELLEAGPSEPPQNKSAEMMVLYGKDWQKIAALELSLQSSFMCESDISKPTYWPNIPLNFS